VIIKGVDKRTFEEELLELFDSTGAALGLVMTFPWKLSEALAARPSRGFLNFHYGSLPQYRGGDPLFSQLANREQMAGLTIHQISDKMDAGEIVLQQKILIKDGCTYGWLARELGELGAQLSEKLFQLFAFAEKLPARAQEEDKAGWYNKPVLRDITINWKEMGGGQILALIRACNPWNKGAITMISGQVVRLLDAEIQEPDKPEILPSGTIVSLNSGNIDVSTADNKILRVKMIYMPEGYMSADKLILYGIKEGNSFE
jgi:methionyl-tRNA formyltransferase